MKSNKLLAKSITLGLILAMPYGGVSAATYEGGTITGWGGVNGGTLQEGESSDKITVTNDNDPATSQACQIVNKGATAKNTVLTGNESGTGGRQDVYGIAIGTQVGQNAQVYVRGGNASNLENNGGTIIIGGTVGETSYAGTVSDMTMNSGNVTVTNGILKESTVNGGYVRIEDNGTADDIKLNSGVTVHVINGYLQNSTINGAYVEVREGTASGNTLSNGQIVLNKGTMNKTTVKGGMFTVNSGLAQYTNVDGGSLVINDGIVKNSELNKGRIDLVNGTLNSTTATNGIIDVNAGNINDLTLSGTALNIGDKNSSETITAKNINAEKDSVVTINNGTIDTITSGTNNTFSVHGGSLSNVALGGTDKDNTSYMGVDGGSIDGLTVEGYGSATITGGTVTNTIIKENGWQGVKNDAIVSNTIIESGGRQTIYENAKSSDVTLNTGAELVVNQGAEAENVKSDGTIYMRDNSKLAGTTTLSENAVIDLGGIVNGLYAEDKLSGREDTGNYSIEDLTSNGAGVKVFTESQKLNIDSLSGSEFVVTTDALGDGLVTIENNTNQNVQVIGTSTATSQFNRNDLAGSLQQLADTVEITSGNQLDSVLAQESNIIGETTALVDEYGNIIANTVIEKGHIANEGITELANVAFMAWRAENDEMHQRMGELRSSNGEAGIWARMKRGESKYGDMDIKNQYSTYQLGYDEKVGDSNWYIGGAISRTEGKSSFATGSGENQSTGFTVYGTYVADDGQYVDLSAKYARLDNEFDVFGRSGIESTGDYRNNGYAFSAEYGKRIEAGNDFWVEPQVQLTYGHLSSANYTTSRDVRVTQDAMDSVVGRLGFAAGKDIGAGNVYVKASYLYDFDGDTNVKMTDGINSAVYDQDLGGGWFEVGIGTNINLSETSHLYFDVEKTYGGDIETPWQWNAGVRFDF